MYMYMEIYESAQNFNFIHLLNDFCFCRTYIFLHFKTWEVSCYIGIVRSVNAKK